MNRPTTAPAPSFTLSTGPAGPFAPAGPVGPVGPFFDQETFFHPFLHFVFFLTIVVCPSLFFTQA
ncbi:MAG: hypothetical protein V9E82_10710 [Candidatus Nanopelagicales bacterium]